MKNNQLYFEKNILMLGCGAVAQCALPILIKEFNIKPSQITVLDFVDNTDRVKQLIEHGMIYKQLKIDKKNYIQLLNEHLKSGDILIDFSFGIGTIDLLDWCYKNDVKYLNASFEFWYDFETLKNLDIREQTLYMHQKALPALIEKWGKNDGPTAIIDHGANPGLVSSLCKQGLEDIAKKIINEKPNDERIGILQDALQKRDFAKLAQLTGVKTIHISERDSQIVNKPKEVNEFVNTWSIYSLAEECTAPAEIARGSHELTLPKSISSSKSGPNNFSLQSLGMNSYARSWVPSGPIIGMVIRHGEAFTISDKLTFWQNDQVLYRPTVHFVYLPCDSAMNSLYEFRMRDLELQPKIRVLYDEIIDGHDELGVLLMGHDFNAWWIGSVLSINVARSFVSHQNATTLQVAASAVAGVAYLINHPKIGVLLPDDLDHHEILNFVKPYLGKYVSTPTDWNLRKHNPDISEDDMWQFNSFLKS